MKLKKRSIQEVKIDLKLIYERKQGKLTVNLKRPQGRGELEMTSEKS